MLSRSTTTLIALCLAACMNEPPAKTDAAKVVTPAAAADPEGSAEPPDPPGYVAPLIYGREPPRAGPIERSSVWRVHGPGGSVEHSVTCDSMQHPELRELLRVLFADASPSATAPALAPDATLVIEIEWREHGKPVAVSELYTDGTLVRDNNGTRTVDGQLDAAALAAVEAEIERAGLRERSRTWCP